MKIVIDCRYLGKSGIGRALENVLTSLDYENNYYIFWGKKEYIEKYKANEYIYDELSPFSVKSMFTKACKEINKGDYLFTPNFIIPYGIKIPIISMIHDVIFLDMPSINKNKIEYILKKHLLKRCTKKSKQVVTVSNFSLNRIIHFFPKNKDKYVYHYNGVADSFKNYISSGIKKDQIVYVGNIKKHKGLKILLEAYQKIDMNKIKLIIVGDDKDFRNGDEEVKEIIKKIDVTFTGRVDDDKLKEIISESKFLILPTLYEGFGLTPLEALYLGTKPIISDIEVLKEVYTGLPVEFFKAGDIDDLAKKISEISFDVALDKEYCNEKFSNKKFTKFVFELMK